MDWLSIGTLKVYYGGLESRMKSRSARPDTVCSSEPCATNASHRDGGLPSGSQGNGIVEDVRTVFERLGDASIYIPTIRPDLASKKIRL